jgi:hypothetical protein
MLAEKPLPSTNTRLIIFPPVFRVLRCLRFELVPLRLSGASAYRAIARLRARERSADDLAGPEHREDEERGGHAASLVAYCAEGIKTVVSSSLSTVGASTANG